MMPCAYNVKRIHLYIFFPVNVSMPQRIEGKPFSLKLTRLVTQNPWHLFIKNCVFILTCLKFSYLQRTLHFMQYTYRGFFPVLQTVRNLLVLVPFSACAIFCFTSSTSEDVSLWWLFSTGETKKATGGKTGWIGRVGHGGHAHFGQKLLNTHRGTGRCTDKSPIMKRANGCWKSLQKIHWSRMQPLTTMPDTDEFLEHSPGGRSLCYKGPTCQKTIPCFGGDFPHLPKTSRDLDPLLQKPHSLCQL